MLLAVLPVWGQPYPNRPVRMIVPYAVGGASDTTARILSAKLAERLKQQIVLAKAKPGTINYGSAGIGATSHLAMAMFNSLTGTKMVHVPYKGSVPATADLVAGHLQVGTPTLPAALPYEKSGQLKVLAVTSAKRWPTLPNVPTLAESGLPEYEVILWTGLMAPAGTPPEAIALR